MGGMVMVWRRGWCGQTTLGLKCAFRGLGLGAFHPVPGTWLVLEDLCLVQFELYRGGVQNLPVS